MIRKVLIIAAALALAACAGNGAEPVSGTISVTGQDYSFSGVPEVVASGAEFTFTNSSGAEVHEMVLVKVADVETRTIEELLELPEEESNTLVEFQGVLVALPGEEGANPEGPGSSITVTEPGRYALVCFIPQGADPAAVSEAMAGGGEGPPDMGDGTPHALLGMWAEFQVDEA
jgi:plastocyanin